MDYVMLKSYDGKLVKVNIEQKDEYLRKQKLIKKYLDMGKTKKEVIELIKSGELDAKNS